jgi:hypothetical protein
MEAGGMSGFKRLKSTGRKRSAAIKNLLSFLDAFAAHSEAGEEEKRKRTENEARVETERRKPRVNLSSAEFKL